MKQATTLVVPTSGSFGISLAAQVVSKGLDFAKKFFESLLPEAQFFSHETTGHRVIVTVPEKTSADQVALLKSLGAEIWRTPNKAAFNSPQSNFGLAKKLAGEIPGAVLIDEV